MNPNPIVRNIPVFAFPPTLKFYLNNKHSYKQSLALYNPYDFPVRFKVLSTNPNKYTVIDPEGSIGPKSCVDLIIRHTMPTATNCSVLDKFRISYLDHTTRQVLGHRDVESRLLNTEPDSASNEGDTFQNLLLTERGPENKQQAMQYPMTNIHSQSNHTTNKLIAIVTAVVAIGALLLPTHLVDSPESSVIPTHFHLSVNLKLVFSYVLGIVTMVIFIRP